MFVSKLNRYFVKPHTDFSLLANPRIAAKNLWMHLTSGRSDADHIFVLGPPRNGTTLLRQIVLANDATCGPDTETFFFCRRRFDNFAINDPDSPDLQALFWSSRSRVEMFDRIASHYCKGAARRFVEKSPQHALVLDFISQSYAKAKILFIYRDGRDAFVSAQRHWEVAGKIGNNYPHLWRDSVRNLLDLTGRENILAVRYETLVQGPEQTIRSVMEFVGLQYQDSQIDPSAYSQSRVAEEREHARLREKISSRSVGVHREPEHEESTRYFESVAGPELVELGYELGNGLADARVRTH